MTKPLPQRDVAATPTRSGPPRLTAAEQKVLANVPSEELKKVIAELLISSRSSQENFQKIEEWFPVQPEDIHAVSGLPFREALWGEVEDVEGKAKFARGGKGLSTTRVSKGVYRILVEAGSTFETPGDFIAALPHVAAGTQAVAIDVEPTEVGGIGGWLVHLFQDVAISEPVDSTFYFLAANFVDQAGNTIVGPRGPAGPTHRALLYGAGAPEAEEGEIDDFYVDIENFLFYGPKTKEGWGEPSSLQGPEGKEGKEGKQGPEGKGGQSGFRYTYLTETANTDPGAGKLKFNGAINLATRLYISETDKDGNAVAPFLATLDDSTNAVKGTIILRKEQEPKVFAAFQVTGALTDNGTWDTLVVTYVTSSGLANNDEVVLQFYRAGDVGPKELLESEGVIEWKQESKTLREKIRGWYDGAVHILEMVAGEGEEASLISKLFIEGGGSKLLARISAKVGAEERLIVNGEGKSSFAMGLIGEMKSWPGISLPSVKGEEYKWCDGSAVSRTTYKTCFERLCLSTTATRVSGTKKLTAIPTTSGMKAGMPISGTGISAGTTITSILSGTELEMSANATSSGSGGALVVAPYGVGDGSTTFNLPDSRGRVGVSPDDMGGTDAGRISTESQRLGGSGGEEKHTLSEGEMPKHKHAIHNDFSAGVMTGFHVQFNAGTTDPNSSDTAGNNEAHNNMQPFLNVNAIIRVL